MLYYEMLKVQILAIAVDSRWMACSCCAGKGSEQGKGPGQKGEESVGYLACGCAGVKPVRAACCSQKGIVLM